VRPFIGVLAACAACTLACGCAVTRLTEDGGREVTGWVKIRLPGPKEATGGETIEVTSWGILLFSSPVGSGVSLGYSRERVTGLKNDALVAEQ
jgi:hypothetical protein